MVTDPVGQVDLAPTFCAIAGIEPAEWMQGHAFPTADGSGDQHERVLCEWDSQFPGYGMHLRSVYRDGWLCTEYEESTDGQPNGLEKSWGPNVLNTCGIHYDGTEGELYNLAEDPHQFHNLWNDAGYKARRDELVTDLRDSFARIPRRELDVEAPAFWAHPQAVHLVTPRRAGRCARPACDCARSGQASQRLRLSMTQAGLVPPSISIVMRMRVWTPPLISVTSTSSAPPRMRLPTGTGAGKRILSVP